MRAPALAAFVLVIAGCAATAPDQDSRRPGEQGQVGEVPEVPDGMSAAGQSLLVKGTNERRSGDLRAASATLERSLGIEPDAPAIWLELARVRLMEGNYAQAEQLARKASSLAATNDAIASQCVQVIAEALRKQGRNKEAESLFQ